MKPILYWEADGCLYENYHEALIALNNRDKDKNGIEND